MPRDDWTFATLVRNYLSISAWKKAIFYLSFVTILSVVSDMFHMSEHCEYIKVSLWEKCPEYFKREPTVPQAQKRFTVSNESELGKAARCTDHSRWLQITKSKAKQIPARGSDQESGRKA